MRKKALTFLSLLLVAVCAFADVLSDWQTDQTAIANLLQEKRYADARKASIKLTNRMLDRLGTTSEASQMLAKTVSLRASSEEGLGNTAESLWYRQVALCLDPHIVEPADAKPLPVPIRAVPSLDSSIAIPGSKTEAPQPTRRRMPDKPAIVNTLGEAIVTVSVVIDTDGIVRQPGIVRSPAPSVSYAALEAVKQWRFRPGKMDGKPVPVIFNLTFQIH
jgi:TonB family protein